MIHPNHVVPGVHPVDIAYSPAFLFDFSWVSSSITSDPEYVSGCKSGYDMYFEMMFQWNADGTAFVFVEQSYTYQQVQAEVLENLTSRDCPLYGCTPFPHCIGFVCGWLSALATANFSLASAGIVYLREILLEMAPLTIAVVAQEVLSSPYPINGAAYYG